MMKNRPLMSEGRSHAGRPRPERPWQLRVGFWLLLAIAAFYLLTEHRAHLALGLPYLPFLLLAACPLLHVFGHGSHGGHHGYAPPRLPDGNASWSDDAGAGAAEHRADALHQHRGDRP